MPRDFRYISDRYLIDIKEECVYKDMCRSGTFYYRYISASERSIMRLLDEKVVLRGDQVFKLNANKTALFEAIRRKSRVTSDFGECLYHEFLGVHIYGLSFSWWNDVPKYVMVIPEGLYNGIAVGNTQVSSGITLHVAFDDPFEDVYDV